MEEEQLWKNNILSSVLDRLSRQLETQFWISGERLVSSKCKCLRHLLTERECYRNG